MKKRIFTGAATALVTPMNADGSVNIPVALRSYMGGVDKILPKR